MNQDYEFADSFGKTAKASMLCILAQAGIIAYYIWFLVERFVKDYDVTLDSLLGSFMLALLVGIVFFIAHLLFCVAIGKLGDYNNGFKILSVYGTIACLLPLTGFVAVVQIFQSELLMVVVAVIIAILVISVKPIYYWLMQKEISKRMPGKAVIFWRVLFIIGSVVILLCVVTFVCAEYYHAHDYKWKEAHKAFNDFIVDGALFVAAIIYVIRMIFEFICTLITAKRLKETY